MMKKNWITKKDLLASLNLPIRWLLLSSLIIVMILAGNQPVSGQMPDECVGSRSEWESEIRRIRENLENSRNAESDNLLTTRGNFGKGRGRIPRWSEAMMQDPVMSSMVRLAQEDTANWTGRQRADYMYAQQVAALSYQADTWRQRSPGLVGGNSRIAAEREAAEIPKIIAYINRCFPEEEAVVTGPHAWVEDTVNPNEGLNMELEIYSCDEPESEWLGTLTFSDDSGSTTFDISFVPNTDIPVRVGQEPELVDGDFYAGIILEYLIYFDEEVNGVDKLVFDGDIYFWFLSPEPFTDKSTFSVPVQYGEDDRCPP